MDWLCKKLGHDVQPPIKHSTTELGKHFAVCHRCHKIIHLSTVRTIDYVDDDGHLYTVRSYEKNP